MDAFHLIRCLAVTKSLLSGRAVHARIVTYGIHSDIFINNHLLSMYLSFESVDDVRNVFGNMPKRNIFTWTTLISKYSQLGLSEEALNCFKLMVCDGLAPNEFTYVGAISACANLEAARTGKEIHGRMVRTEQELNSFVSNSLINFYGKCGLLTSARAAFDANSVPTPVSWASLLSCCCKCGENEGGLEIFLQSLRAGVRINEFSLSSVLGASAALVKLEFGMQVHGQALKHGVRMDPFVATGLVNFYAKCGELDLARKAFYEADKPDLASWTALIGACVQQGHGKEAMDLFRKLHFSCLKSNEKTLASVLGAFSEAMEVEAGKQLHSFIIRLGFDAFTFVGNALMDFYLKCQLPMDSLKAFDEMDEHDIVTWNTMIAGCISLAQYEEAVRLLRYMLLEGFNPNIYTYSSILSICGDLPAIEWGKETHCSIIKPGFDSDVVVGSALVDMYAKCGRLLNARKVFDTLPSKNIFSWNTMVVAYAQHGFGEEALEIYYMMQRNGVTPNAITFVGLFSACAHGGLLEEGLHHFKTMTEVYGITPRTDHLACMVSLFARKGRTKEAYDFISSSSLEPDKVIWRCLLSNCKAPKDFDLGKYAAEKILSIDPDDTSAHIMLSNMYAESKMWGETAQVRKVIKEKALKKDTGYSWTALKNKIYSFSSGRNTHFQENSACEVLSGLTAQLVDEGYAPDALLTMHYE